MSSTPCPARGPTGCQPWTSGRCLALGRLAWVWCEPPQDHQEPAPGPAAPCLRWDSPWWWTRLGWSALRHQVVAGAGGQERPELREPWATARAQEAGGADCTATPGPHRREAAVEAGLSRSRQACPPGAAPPRAAARDVPSFALCSAVVGEGHPGNGRRAGGPARRARARRVTVRHPGLVPDLGGEARAEARGGPGRCALAPDKPGARDRARARPHSGVRPPVSPLGTGPPQGRGNGHVDGRPGLGATCGGPPMPLGPPRSWGSRARVCQAAAEVCNSRVSLRRGWARARGRRASGSVKGPRQEGPGRRRLGGGASHGVAAACCPVGQGRFWQA